MRRAVVVLAAGQSSRMGEHKLLLPLQGKAVVRHAVKTALEADIGEVFVVLGRDAVQVAGVLSDLPCSFLMNPQFQSGMGSSFRVAAEMLGHMDRLVFMLADMPFVSVKTLKEVASTEADLVSCQYGAFQAPPVQFSKQFFPELLTLQEGAKPILQKHRESLVLIQADLSEALDLDTPEDYSKAISKVSEALEP
ncbi:nucleotidyltransferase family protein [Deinococcus misasensis]|uniref:nucleotidyltransferase family protein n=1 Tax=Deinococcus misasensis TaxID=392413 RepID=UPI00055910E0|nr:nucleotidyltransferase family protein [Deinococcus misasensis]